MGSKKFEKLYEYFDEIVKGIKDNRLADIFRQCYFNTLETTVECNDDEVFVITGDIPAMWLRDSSVQVSHYVRTVAFDPDSDFLVRKLLERQFKFIAVDPYANAFNREANGNGHKDITLNNDLVWERKYEIDSLIYPLWLLNKYYSYKKDKNIFNGLFFDTFKIILDTLVTEQKHHEKSSYSFKRVGTNYYDSLPNDGKGGDCAVTGMSWSAFRPSDDRCEYAYLIPSNLFIVATLKQLCLNLEECKIENPYFDKCNILIADIEMGVQTYGIANHPKFGKIYAFEADGLGNQLLMDDANVPSLLSLPYMGYCDINDPIYQNTRKFILSKENPFYFEGKCAKGIGSPHTPKDYIWHIALIIQALTTRDDVEVKRILDCLINTTAGTGFMHEGFDCNDSNNFTRPWFAWANTLFAIFVLDKVL